MRAFSSREAAPEQGDSRFGMKYYQYDIFIHVVHISALRWRRYQQDASTPRQGSSSEHHDSSMDGHPACWGPDGEVLRDYGKTIF